MTTYDILLGHVNSVWKEIICRRRESVMARANL